MPRKLFDGTFRGPGRPAGSLSGRGQALLVLDRVMSDAGNLAKLEEALQADFDKSPLRFYQRFVVPLLPREATLALADAGPQVVKWVSLLDNIKQADALPQKRAWIQPPDAADNPSG